MSDQDDKLTWRPCCSRAEIEAFAGEQGTLTPLEICALPDPPGDLLRTLLRPGILPARVFCELAYTFAGRAGAFAEAALTCEQAAGREPGPCALATVEVLSRWLNGEAAAENLATATAAIEAASEVTWATKTDSAGAAVEAVAFATRAANSAMVAAPAAAAAAKAAEAAAGAAAWAADAGAPRADLDGNWPAKARATAWTAERTWQLQQVRLALKAQQG